MKKTTSTIVAFLLLITCTHDFENPSDPEADDFSVHSNAVLHVITEGDIAAGEPVYFYGGISSDAVEEASLVTEYAWDFDGNGTIDTVLKQSDTISFVYEDTGIYHCILALTDKAGYHDSVSQIIRIKNMRNDRKDTVIIVFNINDTLSIEIDLHKTVKVVTRSGDTLYVSAPQQDSICVMTSTDDKVSFNVKQLDTLTVSTTPVITPPADQIYLPGFPSISGFPDIDGGECAFFTSDSSLMRTTLDFYNIMWEQTRSDGLEAIEFIEKLVTDIIGYTIITLVGGDYTYTFSNGNYRFSTSEGFEISCAFHYGSGIDNHSENDTVKANLFSLDSYVKGLRATLTPPFYSFDEGPLFDLLDGNVSVDNSLKVSFKVNFSRLKISFSRETVHESATLPLYVVNDSIRTPITHESYARMSPVYLTGFADQFHNDSIVINHDGSRMLSKPVALEVIFRSDSTFRKATYNFSIQQKMDTQRTAYGDHDGILKLSGDYTATATLDFNGFPHSTYFKGRYSSAVHDSSWFYCNKEFTNEFGTLFFGATSDSTGIFNSEKYEYAFPYTPLKITLKQYIE